MLRAHAASGPLRRARRVPPRSYRAELEDDGASDTRAAAETDARVVFVGVGCGVHVNAAHQAETIKSPTHSQPSPNRIERHDHSTEHFFDSIGQYRKSRGDKFGR